MSLSVKPDHWIRRMALEHGMIEPFVDGQIRDGVISYGLSSFGYDIRVADEYRIFTASTGLLSVVDPKAIDESAMVAYKGDVCIIPPNSFALARTVEYFRIPRNVITICLGKSTYARCFRGDTRVALVDGTAPTLEEMARRHGDGEVFWGYSMDSHGWQVVALLDRPRFIGRDVLCQITLDNGESIYCTPDHEFLLRDGWMQAAHELRPDTSLMPLYRDFYRGHEMVYQPWKGQMAPTHRLVEDGKVRYRTAAGMPGPYCRAGAPWSTTRLGAGVGVLNHKVKSIHELPGTHDVYCLTVPGTGNFALEAGVFVHNCGIIVNVTPFEPEWEGYVTLEISNTTPLPAKIYSNEGIAQVLFFEGEQPEVSYADRKGKYQKQIGIALPKI
jgi:deoxycytidine triphosphate deaminase